MAASIPVPIVPIPEKDQALFQSVNTYAHAYMSSPGHDNSHDYHHILRVVSNVKRILEAELQARPTDQYDISALFLAALLHDVGDHKYAKPSEDVENQVAKILLDRGASEQLALKVQTIVNYVGYSKEVKDPQSVVSVIASYPELAIVQDADRLDAIGAVGVARCFAYGGAKRHGEPMAVAIDHFAEKLYRLPDMMKTETGKRLAAPRKRILEEFAAQFGEEVKLSFDLN